MGLCTLVVRYQLAGALHALVGLQLRRKPYKAFVTDQRL